MCVTRPALFRPQTGSLGPRAVRCCWRGPKLLGLDRGHEIKDGLGRPDVTIKLHYNTLRKVARIPLKPSKEAEPVGLKRPTAGVLKCAIPWTGGAGVCEVAGHLKR